MLLESEKSNADETRLDENPSEACLPASLKVNEGFKSPIFSLKVRKSTDSLLSDKDAAEDETVEPQPAAKEKNSETTKPSPEKDPEKVSDSDQLRKLELALERIKGYVSLKDDTDKETSEAQSEVIEEKDADNEDKNDSEEAARSSSDRIKLSPLIRKRVTVPVVETSTVQENVEDVSVTLEAMKKTDSFFSKLNETIESCKAKLGISEINDDISSDESAGDENGSKSEDEEEDSSASEAGEEASEEDETMEVSDEEAENGNAAEKEKTGSLNGDTGDDESADSDSDDESSGSGEESSGTDIESSNEETVKTSRKLNDSEGAIEESSSESQVNAVLEENAKEMVCDKNKTDVANLVGNKTVITNVDSNEAIITNPDVQVPEVTIDNSEALEIIDDNGSSENSIGLRESSKSSPNELPRHKNSERLSPSKILGKDSSVWSSPRISSSEVAKHRNTNISSAESNILTTSSIDFFTSEKRNLPNDVEKMVCLSEARTSSETVASQGTDNMKLANSAKIKSNDEGNSTSSVSLKKEIEEEKVDDDIFIFTPAKPKSPPVIVLDDDQDNEESSASDTFAVKSPPYSTSVESLCNEEVLAPRTNPNNDNNRERFPVPSESSLAEKKWRLVEAESEDKPNHRSETRKRSLSSDDESSASDDDVRVVTPLKKPKPLTGAIRTFNKPSTSNTPSLKPTTPTLETVKRNLERESLNLLSESPPLPIESPEVESKFFKIILSF